MIFEPGKIDTTTAPFEEAEKSVKDSIQKMVQNNGNQTVDHFHKALGKSNVG
jgi:succinate dehydrogenase / fumarate reductase flavoprotein subunit